MVITGENVYIVWWTNRTGDYEVMFRASNDNGQTFGKEINLSRSPGADSESAELVASANNVLVSWIESSLTNVTVESVLRMSNDSGQTFGPTLKLSDNSTIGGGQRDSKLLIYDNAGYGIKIQYPANWKIVDGDEDNDGVNDIAGFYTPFENRLDRYEERLWITNDNLLGQNMTLEEYATQVINQNNATLQDFNLLDLDTENTILAGRPGYKIIYTSLSRDDQVIKQMEIGTIIQGQVYYPTYYAEEEKYPKFLPTVQEMINSFEIVR
jgi:hypothetical protein